MTNMQREAATKLARVSGTALVTIVLLVLIAPRFYQSVDAGHVAVATLFGDVREQPYASGLHFPVNPFYRFREYDVRQKTHMEEVSVPSQDQLQTTIEVSVQYRLIEAEAPRMLGETGLAPEMINVHLIPKVRSVLREQGKSVEKAEHFFLEETQQTLQNNVLTALREYCQPKGIEIDAVLLRDIRLPAFITRAIESKKEREQAAEQQKAELERFRTEQEQKIAQAEAERKAAQEQAEMKKVLADAQAYEIQKINEAIAANPAYIQLEALKALQSISKDPAAKMYFMSGDSPMPLPLMHMGEAIKQDE